MQSLKKSVTGVLTLSLISLLISSCSTTYRNEDGSSRSTLSFFQTDYSSRMPSQLATNGHKVIVVDPNVHAWGAYNPDGSLERAGPATAGGNFCPDIGKPCRTSVGSFRIYSLGDGACVSRIFPRPNGGGLMPYCMFFKGGQALHGSPDGTVVEDNISHGCVRMRIPDAEWVRYNFATVGTQVIIRPY